MVFKVKRRAESNYFNKSVQNNNKLTTPKTIPKDVQSLMNIEPLDFVSAGAAKGAVAKEGIEKLTYNWPYDFFSLVELVKVDAEVIIETPVSPLSSTATTTDPTQPSVEGVPVDDTHKHNVKGTT